MRRGAIAFSLSRVMARLTDPMRTKPPVTAQISFSEELLNDFCVRTTRAHLNMLDLAYAPSGITGVEQEEAASEMWWANVISNRDFAPTTK